MGIVPTAPPVAGSVISIVSVTGYRRGSVTVLGPLMPPGFAGNRRFKPRVSGRRGTPPHLPLDSGMFEPAGTGKSYRHGRDEAAQGSALAPPRLVDHVVRPRAAPISAAGGGRRRTVGPGPVRPRLAGRRGGPG